MVSRMRTTALATAAWPMEMAMEVRRMATAMATATATATATALRIVSCRAMGRPTVVDTDFLTSKPVDIGDVLAEACSPEGGASLHIGPPPNELRYGITAHRASSQE